MKHTPRRNDSLGYYNLIRGLGLFFIIAGHSVAPFLSGMPPITAGPLFQGAGRVLGSGILAMFFMISGLGFYRRSPKKCLTIQTKLLLKPYAITALILILGKMALAFFKGNSVLNQATSLSLTFLLGLNASQGGQLLGIRVTTISILWFVLALYGGWLLYNLIAQLPGKTARCLCVLGCILLSWVLSLFSKVWPFTLPMALMAAGYIAAGWAIRERNLLQQPLRWYVWLAVGAVSLVCLMFGYVDVAACSWKLGPLDIAGTFCIAFLLLRLYGRVMELDFGGWPVRILEQVGLNSIWILCLHALEHALIPWRDLSRLLPDSPALCSLICLLGKIAVIWLLFRLVHGLPRKKRRTITIEA